MGFNTEIIERHKKVFNTIDVEYLQLPRFQKTNAIMTQFSFANDHFYCDLYAEPMWLNNNRAIFDFYNGKEAVLDYFYFSVINESFTRDTFTNCSFFCYVVFATMSLLDNASMCSLIRYYSPFYRFLILVNVDMDKTELIDLKSKFNFPDRICLVDAKAVSKQVFTNLIEQNFLSKENMRDMQSLSFLKVIYDNLQDIKNYYQTDKNKLEELEKKKDALRTALNQLNANASDDLIRLKNAIQSVCRDVDRDIRNKYAKLMLPNTGQFSQIIDSIMAQFNIECLDQSETDIKTPIVNLRINEGFLGSIISQLRNILNKNFQNDLVEIQNDYKNLIQVFENKLGFSRLTVDKMISFKNFPDSGGAVSSNVTFSGNLYNGELPKLTYSAIIKEAMQKPMIIRMIFYMIMPLFLFFGVNQYVNTQDPKTISSWQQRSLYQYVTLIVGVVYLSLVLYYYFRLKKKIPAMKQYELTKEFDKPRNALRNELGRIFNVTINNWVAKISEWLKDTEDIINEEYDAYLSSIIKKRQEEKNRIENDLLQVQNEIGVKSRNFTNLQNIINSIVIEETNAMQTLANNLTTIKTKQIVV